LGSTGQLFIAMYLGLLKLSEYSNVILESEIIVIHRLGYLAQVWVLELSYPLIVLVSIILDMVGIEVPYNN
jgi:hypothetical protein